MSEASPRRGSNRAFFSKVFLLYMRHLRTERAQPPAQGCGDDRNVSAAAAKPRVGNVTCRVRARGETKRGGRRRDEDIERGEANDESFCEFSFFLLVLFSYLKSTLAWVAIILIIIIIIITIYSSIQRGGGV